MVTLSTADKVLKTLYLDVVSDQLNNKTNPFYAAIKKGSEEVVGKNAVAICRYGINGGMGSATETGNLPVSSGNNYLDLKIDLKNIYGTIELSDKVIRASQHSSQSLVNVLNSEMEGLLEAAKFNFSRMLWQDGSGTLAELGNISSVTNEMQLPVKETSHIIEGMLVDVVNKTNGNKFAGPLKVTAVDRKNKVVSFSTTVSRTLGFKEGDLLTLQQSYNAELFGLPYLFHNKGQMIYGNSKMAIEPIMPHQFDLNNEISTDAIQEVIDAIDKNSGSEVNMLLTSHDVRRKYLKYLQTTRTNIDYMNLDGGFKAISYSGIPFVADRFCQTSSVYFINTNDFKLVQLCDWQWIENDKGNVLVQLEKTPSYTGTLVKYANLVCTRPFGQGALNNIN